MKSYDTILFDLDGTLTDPGVGITNSVAYALDKFGIAVEDRATLYPFIGPPLRASFQTFSGLTPAQAEEAVGYYREYYREKGLWENRLYPGIDVLLPRLREQGKRLMVATSKPEMFAREILEHFQIAQHFQLIAGATLDGSRDSKPAVIGHALAQMGEKISPSQMVMVGDREYDVLGAKPFGIDTIGVLFGYGSPQELTAAGAVALAASVKELGQLLGVAL